MYCCLPILSTEPQLAKFDFALLGYTVYSYTTPGVSHIIAPNVSLPVQPI